MHRRPYIEKMLSLIVGFEFSIVDLNRQMEDQPESSHRKPGSVW